MVDVCGFLVVERWLGGGFAAVFCRVERRRREIGERKCLAIAWCKIKALLNIYLAEIQGQKGTFAKLHKGLIKGG